MLISIITSSRPDGISYVENTIKYIDNEVEYNIPRVLICHGGRPRGPIPWNWRIIDLPFETKHIDNKYSGWEALRAASELQTDLLFLEDDIKPSRKGSFNEMLAHEVPDGLAFTSFFHAIYPKGNYPCNKFNMSQAVKIPLRTVEYLLGSQKGFMGNWWANRGIDLIIGQFCHFNQMRYEQTDNKIKHVGVVSICSPGNLGSPWAAED